MFDRDRTFVRNAAHAIAVEFDWEENWLNDGVKGFPQRGRRGTGGQASDVHVPVREATGAGDFVASPPYLFAMKSLAMRIGGAEQKPDVDDIRRLGEILGVRNSAPKRLLCLALPPRGAAAAEDAIRAGRDIWTRSVERPRSIAESRLCRRRYPTIRPGVGSSWISWQADRRAAEREAAVESEPALLGDVKDAVSGRARRAPHGV